MDFYHRLLEAAGSDHVLRDEPMAVHTTFRIGGPADYFVEPADASALAKGIALCREVDVDYFVTGNGSNLLVGDGGYRGVIFHICHTMDHIQYEEQEGELLVEAGAGVMLSRLARQVSSMGYTGFEYATGIPGTLGGGVTMNAGAYGGEMKDVLKEVTVMNQDGEILTIPADKLELGYRTSIIKTAGYIVLEAVISLKKGNIEEITALSRKLSAQRIEKQPLEYPSAGSTFKRPEGYFAGKLIMDSNLRGYRVGGAQVSEKHCGFVINAGGATAEDVSILMKNVTDIVYEKFGVKLEPEVKFLGKFDGR